MSEGGQVGCPREIWSDICGRCMLKKERTPQERWVYRKTRPCLALHALRRVASDASRELVCQVVVFASTAATLYSARRAEESADEVYRITSRVGRPPNCWHMTHTAPAIDRAPGSSIFACQTSYRLRQSNRGVLWL